jgi:signal transduction histidine kinase
LIHHPFFRRLYDFLPWFDSIPGLICLIILIAYTYLLFFKIPYLGMQVSSINGNVKEIFVTTPGDAELLLNDQVIAIDTFPYLENLHRIELPAFPDLSPGERVTLTISREGAEKKVHWTVPGFNFPEVFYRLSRIWFIAYIYWLFGFLAALFVRPRDIRWFLFVLFSYLAAIWLLIGYVSYSGLWKSSLVMHSLIWILAAVSWHFHWVFPQPLFNRGFPYPFILYGSAIILAIASWFQWLPYYSYLLGIGLAVLGSFILLILHLWFTETKRIELRLTITSILVLFFVTIELGVILLISDLITPAYLSIWLISFLPFGYYIIIRSGQSKGLRFRTNKDLGRLFTLAFLVLMILLLVVIFKNVIDLPVGGAIIVIGLTLLIGYLSTYAINYLTTWLNRRFIGISSSSSALVRQATNRLATNLEIEGFISFLENHVFRSLLISQVLIIRFTSPYSGTAPEDNKTILSIRVPPEGFPTANEILEIIKSMVTGKNGIQFSSQLSKSNWWLVGLPLQFDNEIIGLCLLGSHDPDDVYTPDEIQLLQVILNHLSFALVYTRQTEQLRSFYFNDVQRMEEERYHLARELHDEILGQLALLVHKFHELKVSTEHIQSIQNIIQQIRQIILGLRSTVLNYGLKAAVDDLVDQLLEQYENRQSLPVVSIVIKGGEYRYPPEVELNIYRIIQQACQNSIIHAHSKSIAITGHLLENEIKINILDDGKGFQLDPDVNLSNLLSSGHFGLAGMHERASFINGRLGIQSTLEKGTLIEIAWTQPGN